MIVSLYSAIDSFIMIRYFTLTNDYIELNKLLKLYGVVDSGGEAKHMITQGFVKVNNDIETRIRRKLVVGDRIITDTMSIIIQSS